MIERLFSNATKLIRLGENVKPTFIEGTVKGGKFLSRVAGKVATEGFKGAAGIANKGLEGFKRIGEKDTIRKTASNVGKFSAHVAQDTEYAIHGVNNILGVATGGVEFESLNKALNKGLDSIPENKAGTWIKDKVGPNGFTGHRYGKLLKDSDESIILGKKATALGGSIIVTGGAIMSAKDAIVDKLHQQQGTVVGSASNAPVNNYAYQGASYADNAGATGDLVLAMHRQRHEGIL